MLSQHEFSCSHYVHNETAVNIPAIHQWHNHKCSHASGVLTHLNRGSAQHVTATHLLPLLPKYGRPSCSSQGCHDSRWRRTACHPTRFSPWSWHVGTGPWVRPGLEWVCRSVIGCALVKYILQTLSLNINWQSSHPLLRGPSVGM